jgi:putative sterol carrier protein
VTDFDPSTFSSVEPEQFAAMVKSASKEQLEAVLAGEQRGKILDEIFSRFPQQFRADRAGATNAVIHWNITGRPDGSADTYEVVIADGACTLSPSPQADPKLTVTIDGVDFLNLITGNGNPMMMFMTGKLKAKGDLGLAANLANLFDLPRG